MLSSHLNVAVTVCTADDTVSSELKKQIMQARLAKKLTQAQLANTINEKPQIIQEYESGKVSEFSSSHAPRHAAPFSNMPLEHLLWAVGTAWHCSRLTGT